MHKRRRSLLLWSAACFLALAPPAGAQIHTMVNPNLPALPDEARPDVDASPTVCRPPQPQTDSRLMGPRVCRTQRQWDDLHARGLDISPDGKGTVPTDKYRAAHAGPCHTLQDSCY